MEIEHQKKAEGIGFIEVESFAPMSLQILILII